MTQAIQRLASSSDRIQRTLELLIQQSAPELHGRVPGLRLAEEGEDVDLPSIRPDAIADPIGAGYALSQQAIANALQCGQSDVSILVKELKLKDAPELAVVVRKGRMREIVNYHSRAIEHLKGIIDSPPGNLSRDAQQAIRRIRKRSAR